MQFTSFTVEKAPTASFDEEKAAVYFKDCTGKITTSVFPIKILKAFGDLTEEDEGRPFNYSFSWVDNDGQKTISFEGYRGINSRIPVGVNCLDITTIKNDVKNQFLIDLDTFFGFLFDLLYAHQETYS